MRNGCIDIERIPEALELPAENAMRRHVETCPRCSAILASHQAFMKVESVAGADPDNAGLRLNAFLASEIGTPREKAGFAFDPKAPSLKRFLSRLTASFFMRPAWITALFAIIAAGLLLWRPWESEPTVLRSSRSTDVLRPLTLSAPQALSGGRFRLEWTPMAGADSYSVRLYDMELNAITQLEPTSVTVLVIDRSMLPADTPNVLIWRVVALQRGDEIGLSDPAHLKLQ
jgi:hypothetical protein